MADLKDAPLKDKVNAFSALIVEIGKDIISGAKKKSRLLFVTIAVIVIALAIFLPSGTGGGSSGGGGYEGWESSKEERNDYGKGSASGTYSWSQGTLYLSITISGDRWYSSANFDVVSSGRIRNKTLYDESGAVSLGRIISSKSISYGNTILYKK